MSDALDYGLLSIVIGSSDRELPFSLAWLYYWIMFVDALYQGCSGPPAFTATSGVQFGLSESLGRVTNQTELTESKSN
jgi:hypothetical protein